MLRVYQYMCTTPLSVSAYWSEICCFVNKVNKFITSSPGPQKHSFTLGTVLMHETSAKSLSFCRASLQPRTHMESRPIPASAVLYLSMEATLNSSLCSAPCTTPVVGQRAQQNGSNQRRFCSRARRRHQSLVVWKEQDPDNNQKRVTGQR